MKITEHQIQSALFQWFKIQHPKLIMFAIPNAAKRSFAQASYMKAEGLISGIADIFLMCANKTHHGLFIELKSAKGKLSEQQAYFLEQAKERGYQAIVCYSFDEAKTAITNYLQEGKS
jgi:hypothetical protein